MRISDWSSDVCSSDLSFSQGASGFTLKGAWGHDEQYLYRPGTYIFETPGVIHQLLNGPEESEILFFGDLALDFVDPEPLDVISVVTADKSIDTHLQKSAEKGVITTNLKWPEIYTECLQRVANTGEGAGRK